jgi:serine/threonine-protein kinase HipA
MAVDAGISVPEAHLQVDGAGRAHFMTRRFDRTDGGEKLHTQTLAAMAHYDYYRAGAHSYEDAMRVLQRLGAPHSDVEEQFRRMVFNVVTRNQDDHTKNITYIMDNKGNWRLSPAYDVIWAYNPSGEWTSHHQMTVSGKRDGFERTDLEAVARSFGIHAPGRVIDDVTEAAARWPKHAEAAEVPESLTQRIEQTLRLDLVV